MITSAICTFHMTKRMSGLMQMNLNIFIIHILFIVACVWLSLSCSQGHFSGISNFIMSVNFISFSFNLYFCIHDNEELDVLQLCLLYILCMHQNENILQVSVLSLCMKCDSN